MSIKEILDACDLHLIYLHPGVFAKLKLKKKHGMLSSFSPPEFPEWTSYTDSCPPDKESVNNSTTNNMRDEVDDTVLLNTFLNVNVPQIHLSADTTEGGNV